MEENSRQFGPFRIVRRLGVGGMAETFEATRQGPGGFEQRVCLKRVLPAFSQDEEFVRQFQREARLAAALRHSNIVGVLDFGEIDGLHYMALELVDGIDLRAFLASREGKRLTAEQAALIGMDLAYALEYAHNLGGRTNGSSTNGSLQGVVHRDVSAANVLIGRAGEIKLADFGIAKAISNASATVSQTIKGKIPYMAPEQMRGHAIDGRADLFSLGVLLFEAVAGERPFDGSHDVETMTRVLAGRRLSISETVPGVPQALASAIENLLETDVEKRTADASALVSELAETAPSPQVRRELGRIVEEQLGGIGTRVHVREQRKLTTADLREKPVPEAPARGARKRGPVLGAAAALVALVALAVTFWPRPVPPKTVTVKEDVVVEPLAPATPAPAPAATLPEVPGSTSPALPDTETEAEAEAEPPPPPAKTTTTTSRDASRKTSATSRPAKSGTGKLTVTVVPWGRVWIDGKYMGRAPVEMVPLKPGRHQVRAGFDKPTETRTVTVSRGELKKFEIEIE